MSAAECFVVVVHTELCCTTSLLAEYVLCQSQSLLLFPAVMLSHNDFLDVGCGFVHGLLTFA